mgnify:FL=1
MPTLAKPEQAEAITKLRRVLKPGDTVYTVLRHTSKSGMYRAIDLYKLPAKGGPLCLSYTATLAMGARFDKRHESIGVSGCGMDMGFHLVYHLGRALWPDGVQCAGEQRCQSNDHTNGDRDYTPHHHQDGGYALRHRWL